MHIKRNADFSDCFSANNTNEAKTETASKKAKLSIRNVCEKNNNTGLDK